ncbi:citrate/2-methylcitrate synthase [Nonomuraea pusilla]|uniref:citrate synthase (unknown stereospecificity) n=1 Tax=Nonomuraea pusilla TaxID=46177 RepID=A0A1H7L1B9_9ACTN|nr:citrate/2-methylcitrate synthase [Nonomuraea pusilla]SEK92811.1 citrate synthase [Nonomuraea pusilla]
MEWIDATTASERLGVKPATLYAYVSRGVLRRRRSDDGRRSLFSAEEVEQLARRGRPRSQPPELVIDSAVTALGPDRPYFRGLDALDLARSHDYESVATWLWTGAPAALTSRGGGWECDEAALRAARAAQHGLPGDLLPLDRLQVITTVLGASDGLRFQLDPASVADTGRRLVAGLVDALPQRSEPAGTSIAERLWSRLTARPAEPPLLRALQAALVLLADHELAPSTLAARVAASARADPYAVVQTGLGVLGGPLHGGASYGAERLLAEVGEAGLAARAVAERVRRGERVPGFGHSVYKNGDGRGALLFGLVEEAAPGHERLAVAHALRDEARRRRLPDPNVDFALAALAAVSGMPPGAGEAVFAVARTAGWLAHAMEEYARGTLLRLRAAYTGPPITR